LDQPVPSVENNKRIKTLSLQSSSLVKPNAEDKQKKACKVKKKNRPLVAYFTNLWLTLNGFVFKNLDYQRQYPYNLHLLSTDKGLDLIRKAEND
jgi:hypothetical protein